MKSAPSGAILRSDLSARHDDGCRERSPRIVGTGVAAPLTVAPIIRGDCFEATQPASAARLAARRFGVGDAGRIRVMMSARPREPWRSGPLARPTQRPDPRTPERIEIESSERGAT
jgi:hypothetical protein